MRWWMLHRRWMRCNSGSCILRWGRRINNYELRIGELWMIGFLSFLRMQESSFPSLRGTKQSSVPERKILQFRRIFL
jgi:hypothetical protein